MLFTTSETTGKDFPMTVSKYGLNLLEFILILNIVMNYRLVLSCCCRLLVVTVIHNRVQGRVGEGKLNIEEVDRFLFYLTNLNINVISVFLRC